MNKPTPRWLPDRRSQPYTVEAYERGTWKVVLATLSGRDAEDELLKDPETKRMVTGREN